MTNPRLSPPPPVLGSVAKTVELNTRRPPEQPKPAERRRSRKPPVVRERGVLAAYPQLVLVALIAGTTSLVYLRFFSDHGFLLGTLSAAAGGTLIAGVAGLRRWPAVVTSALAVLGFALIGVFVVFRSSLHDGIPNWATLTAFGGALVSGWAKMLTVTLPADPTGELVLTPALVTWVAAAVAATIVVRTRALLAPALPLVIAFGIGLPVTASQPVGGIVLIAALLAEILLLIVVRASAADPLARSTGARATWSRLAFGLPVVLVVTLAGVAGAHYLPVADGQHRFDLRSVVPVQLNIGDVISPLAALKGQLLEQPHNLFTVTLSGDTTGVDRVRTAALEDYDGALWTSQDSYLLAGHTLPGDTGIVDPRTVRMTVNVSSLPGPYLPALGAPVAVAAPRVGFDASSGTLATDAPDLTGLHYTVTAELARRTGLDQAVPDLSGDAAEYTALPPGLPPDIREKGQELAGSVQQPYAKLLAIQNYLQSLPYNINARPGHSYDALSRLFDSNPTDQVGYAEQFAAAFAVLARSQGFPTRVAVGYLLNPAHRKGDTYTVSSSDAHAWAEVRLAGYGWVTFEPTNPQRRAGVPLKQQQTDTASQQDQNAQSKASTATVDPNLPGADLRERTPLDWALWVLIGIGALLLLLPIAVLAEKIRRRRVRKSGSRTARLLGAWHEATDRLVTHGVPVTASKTAAEIALVTRERLGDKVTAVGVLAPLVTAAVFGQDEPDDTAVREAWRLDSQLRVQLRGVRGPIAVVRGWFDPRPLFARRRDDRRRRRALDRLTRG